MNELPLDELTGAVARIRGLLLTEEKVSRAVLQLAQAIQEVMPGNPQAGVSLLNVHGERTSSGLTHPLVGQLDAAQFRLGEGPCLTAWASETAVIVDDVRTDDRWPNWRTAVRGFPVRSVLSVPLVDQGTPLGALKIYSPLPGQYDDETARILSLFAGTAATLLGNIQDSDAPLRMADSLKTALYARDTINRACGILMSRHGTTHEQALQQLIRDARAADSTMMEVSERLIASIPPAGS